MSSHPFGVGQQPDEYVRQLESTLNDAQARFEKAEKERDEAIRDFNDASRREREWETEADQLRASRDELAKALREPGLGPHERRHVRHILRYLRDVPGAYAHETDPEGQEDGCRVCEAIMRIARVEGAAASLDEKED